MEIVDREPSFREPYDTYNETGATSIMSSMPRFGHSKDVSSIVETDSSTWNDYQLGTLFAFVIILGPMVIWTICLMIWKCCCCCCPCKAGFLSGDAFRSPYDADRTQFKKWQRHVVRTRLLFVLSCFMVMIFATLLVVKGFVYMDASKNTFVDTNNDLSELLIEAKKITDVMYDVGHVGLQLKSQLETELNSDTICPADDAFQRDDIGVQVVHHADDLVAILNELETQTFVPNRLDNFRKGLDDFLIHTEDFDLMVRAIENVEWMWAIVAIPFIVIPSVMILGTFAAHLQFMNPTFLCMLNWLFLPTLVLWVILAYIACSAMTLISMGHADFCSGSDGVDPTPDSSIMQGLIHYGYTEQDFVMRAGRYYAYQCTNRAESDPFIFLKEYDTKITLASDTMADLQDAINDISLAEMSLLCNRDMEPLAVLVTTSNDVLTALKDATRRTIALLSCDRIVPVYTSIAYDAMCEYSMIGTYWSWVCLVVMSFFGMMMITLRASYQNAYIQRHETPEPQEEYYDPDIQMSQKQENDDDDDEHPDQDPPDEEPEDDDTSKKKRKSKKNKTKKKKKKKEKEVEDDDEDDDDHDDHEQPTGNIEPHYDSDNPSDEETRNHNRNIEEALSSSDDDDTERDGKKGWEFKRT